MTTTGQTRVQHVSGSAVHKGRLKRREQVLHLLLHLILVSFAFLFVIPLLWVFSTSLKRAGQVFILPVQWLPSPAQWDNFREIFEILPLSSFIKNSAFVTVLGTLGSVVSSLVVGFSLSRLRWPGRDLVFGLLIMTMLLPGIVTLIPTFIIFNKLGWVNTLYPLWVPSWFGGAFYIFLMRQFMTGIPREMDEAARLDGASSFRILWQVVAPLCGSAIITVALFSFLAHYNDFMTPLIYLSTNEKFTMPVGLQWYQGRYGQSWQLVMAAATVSVAPVIVLFFVAQRHFVQGIAMTGVAGR